MNLVGQCCEANIIFLLQKAEHNIGNVWFFGFFFFNVKQGASAGVFGLCIALSDHCGALQDKSRFDVVFTAFVDGFIRLQ